MKAKQQRETLSQNICQLHTNFFSFQCAKLDMLLKTDTFLFKGFHFVILLLSVKVTASPSKLKIKACFQHVFILFLIFYFMCMFVYMYVFISPHVYSAPGGQKRALYLLELVLQTIVSYMWVLGTEAIFSTRATSLLTIEPSLQHLKCFIFS